MAESKEYVKLWLSYADYFREYGDASIGAIVRAMLAYRKTENSRSLKAPKDLFGPQFSVILTSP